MKSTLAALAILLVLTGGFYWKLTLSSDWTYLESPDLGIQVRPWLDFAAREFHAGRFPLWDPYEWAGHTLIGQVQPGIANPLNWILFVMPLRDGHIPISTLHWYWVLIHWLAAVMVYALCRDLGAGFLPAILGGCVVSLTGFMGHADWPQILMGCIWIPVVLLFVLRVARDYRPVASAACCGAAMGMAFLGNHHVIPTMTALLVSCMWVVLVAMRPRRAGLFALFLAVTGLVAGFQVLPALEYSRLAIRWAGAPEPILPGQKVPFSVHAEYSLKARELPAFVLPRGATHVEPYVGMTAFALAVLAVAWRRSSGAMWLAGLGVGAVLVALASPPYWLAWRFLPMIEKAREPAFAVVIVQVAVAGLAALGLSRLPRWVAPLALALFLGEAAYRAPHFTPVGRPGSYLAMQRDQAPVVEFLRRQAGWFRVDFDDSVVPYNIGDLNGIEQFGGAVSSMPLRVHRVLGHGETPRTFGIRYRVGSTASDARQVEVFRSASGLKVFEDPRGVEALWSIHQTACGSGDRLRLAGREPERVTVEAEFACAGLMVIGDPYYPGWRAWVDGKRVPIQEVDGVRAVQVSGGSHRIEFRYRPASVYAGLGLTLIGLMLTGWLVGRGGSRAPLALGRPYPTDLVS